MESGTLVGVKVVMVQLTTSYAADGMDEVATEQIIESVLIRIVRIGTEVKVISRRIYSALLVTCIL